MIENNIDNCCLNENTISLEKSPTDIEKKFGEVIDKIKTSIGKLIKKLS